MQLPEKLLQSLANTKGFNKEAFVKIHADTGQITSLRINQQKIFNIQYSISNVQEKVHWTQNGYYLSERPSFTFDPLFHAGCYYVQEASSMFLEQALKQTTDLSRPLKVLDLSAAPGGKSTHIQSLISDGSLLVSNDVIRSRANILKENIIKWGCDNVIVTNNDPRDFSKLENYFDIIVIDAPCSGSGLFRREPEAINEWSENNVALCSQRQQRILADVFPALKNNGILIYSTCSYSKEENEDILEWMIKELKVEGLRLKVEESWGIIESETNSGTGYRFWPDKVKGEGFFIACFRKKAEDEGDSIPLKIKDRIKKLSRKEMEIIEKWAKTDNHQFVKHESTVYAWPEKRAADMDFLLHKLKVIYSGVRIGELLGDKLVPDHALAMSDLIIDSITRVRLDYDQAIRYLQRKELNKEIPGKGWQLATYEGHALGWINVLPNRINNYYPKELRILKESPDEGK